MNILFGWIWEAIGNYGLGYNILYQLAKSLCTWSEGTGTEIVSTVYNYIQPLGVTLALCFAILEILEAMTRAGSNNMTAEIIVMPLFKFVIAYLVIAYGIELIGLVLSASNTFCDWVDTNFSDSLETMEEASLEIQGILAKILIQFIPSMLSLLSQIIAALVIGVQLITIRVEVLLRAIFLPIAVADISSKGTNSSGMRYLKNFIGNIFLLGAILIVIKLTYAVCVDLQDFALASTIEAGISEAGAVNLVTGIYMGVFNGLIGPFVCVSAVTTVKSLIREAFAG
mgnify:FL=1